MRITRFIFLEVSELFFMKNKKGINLFENIRLLNIKLIEFKRTKSKVECKMRDVERKNIIERIV